MQSGSAIQPGRRAAILSLGLGILGLITWMAIVRTSIFTHFSQSPPEWVWVGAFTSVGVVGLLAGLTATFRGRARTRLVGTVGILLSLYLLLLGTLPLWFRLPNLLGTGPFM